MVREQEASRLLKEILCHLNANQSIGASIPANRVTEPPTNIAAQLPASNELTTITQFPVTSMAAPPNVPEVAGESGWETDGEANTMLSEEVHTSWLIPNCMEDCVPDEFACRWTPCNVVFDTYGELIQHIRAHQLAFQCQ
jgi:hypothetical protein